jgi:hypothetical protein
MILIAVGVAWETLEGVPVNTGSLQFVELEGPRNGDTVVPVNVTTLVG